MTTLWLNGEHIETSAATVGALLAARAIGPRGVAVAVNGTVIPRSQWHSTDLSHEDSVEVVTAAAGG